MRAPIFAGLAAFVASAAFTLPVTAGNTTGNHVVTGELQPAVRMSTVPCPATTWSAWDAVPTCDLDGSQTWVLADEVTDLTVDPAVECANVGGVHSVSVTDPVTHYCIDVDY